MRLRSWQNENGSAILPILMVAAIAAVIGYASLDVIRTGRDAAVTEERRIEAEAIANDVLEITKYLILYEPVFYTDAEGPLNHSGERGKNLIHLMGMGIGATSDDSMDLLRACGGYDAKGRLIGEYKLNGVSVFCPLYFRSALMSTDMLDQMILQPLVLSGVMTSPKPGQYTMELVFFDKAAGIDHLSKGKNAGTFIDFDIGQNLLKAAQFRIDRVSTKIRFLSTQSGFAEKTSARFFEISSEVRLTGVGRVIVGRKQSYITYPSTPRDFTLFMLYPSKEDGTPTKLWSQSMNIPSDSTIEGRVLFNGDIDVPLSSLPTFTEVVVLTGDFKPALTLADHSLFRQKFLKGVMTNYSAPRYLLSGQCSATDPSINISNGTNFFCSTNGHRTMIGDYLTMIPSKCVRPPVTSTDGSTTVGCDLSADAASCPTDCPSPALISGPRKTVSINGTYGFIAAPVSRLTNSASHLYGTVFGGHFESSVPVHMFSMSIVRPGLPGIGSQEISDSYTGLFNQAYSGISIPLENLPIVYEEGISK